MLFASHPVYTITVNIIKDIVTCCVQYLILLCCFCRIMPMCFAILCGWYAKYICQTVSKTVCQIRKHCRRADIYFCLIWQLDKMVQIPNWLKSIVPLAFTCGDLDWIQLVAGRPVYRWLCKLPSSRRDPDLFPLKWQSKTLWVWSRWPRGIAQGPANAQKFTSARVAL